MMSLEDVVVSTTDSLRPLERMNAWQAGEKYWHLSGIGSKNGHYSIESTPYMREPAEVLGSLEYRAMCFVGPARTGKSALCNSWICQTVMCDPTDMRVFNMTKETARDYSKTDLTRMFNRSPELRGMLRGSQDDNVHDKAFRHGMHLMIKWPSITELSGNTTQRIWLFDYDRGEGYQNVDGEGPAFPLARKRTETYGRFGMVGVESSPGFDVEDPNWIAKTPHQGPPIKQGVMSIYNDGDRRRWNWACPNCHTAFEPDFNLFHYPKGSVDLMESAEQVVLRCPHCGFDIPPGMRDELNSGGTWVKDNHIWIPGENRIVLLNGRSPIRSDIASFWLKSPPAFFAKWQDIVLRYLQAERHYEETHDEGKLKTVTNLDLGHPYTSRANISDRVPEELKARAEDWGGSKESPVVPVGARFLVATVDIGVRAFFVQVHGIGVGGDIFIVDSFRVTKSKRLDAEGDPLPIDPAAFDEDWDQLIDEVILRSYPLGDGSGRKMGVMFTGSDLAGKEGFTIRALNFWRRLKSNALGHHRRFALLRGDPNPKGQLVRLTYPEAGKNRFSGAAGDVPVFAINSNAVKDQLSNLLGKTEPGGMIRWPDWLPDWWYVQMTNEVRVDGKWVKPAGKRNEAWDLLYYCLAFLYRRHDDSGFPLIELDKIDWENPKSWAAEWDRNDFVFSPAVQDSASFVSRPKRSLKDLAADLA